jgi:Tol biopolymer transport system component
MVFLPTLVKTTPSSVMIVALLVGCVPRDAATLDAPKAAATSTAATSTADEAPATDIYLADLDLSSIPPGLTGVRNLTDRAGYDNQPYFADAEGKLLYTSIRERQADIYALDLAGEVTERSGVLVHGNPANEYSPTLMPDRRGISMIRENKGVQTLWHYSTDGKDLGALLPDVADVGYHAWLSTDDVALFILDTDNEDKPRHRLEVVHIPDGKRHVVAAGIGRCLAVYPRSSVASGAITFVRLEDAPTPSTILRYDLATRSTTELLKTRPKSEDYAWAPDGSLLMAEGTVLHRWTADAGWQVLADLASKGIEHISRLAVSGDGRRVALVVGQKPTDD